MKIRCLPFLCCQLIELQAALTSASDKRQVTCPKLFLSTAQVTRQESDGFTKIDPFS